MKYIHSVKIADERVFKYCTYIYIYIYIYIYTCTENSSPYITYMYTVTHLIVQFGELKFPVSCSNREQRCSLSRIYLQGKRSKVSTVGLLSTMFRNINNFLYLLFYW